jgi:hypothetical protein
MVGGSLVSVMAGRSGDAVGAGAAGDGAAGDFRRGAARLVMRAGRRAAFRVAFRVAFRDVFLEAVLRAADFFLLPVRRDLPPAAFRVFFLLRAPFFAMEKLLSIDAARRGAEWRILTQDGAFQRFDGSKVVRRFESSMVRPTVRRFRRFVLDRRPFGPPNRRTAEPSNPVLPCHTPVAQSSTCGRRGR